jgi:hypothetical protein
VADDWTVEHAHVQESRWSTEAPKTPTHRPPTRAEVWAYVEHYYRGVKTKEQAIVLAIRIFTGNYIQWVQVEGWDMPPDWQEGEPIVFEARPKGRPFDHNVSQPSKWRDQINALLMAQGKRPLPARSHSEQKEEDEL